MRKFFALLSIFILLGLVGCAVAQRAPTASSLPKTTQVKAGSEEAFHMGLDQPYYLRGLTRHCIADSSDAYYLYGAKHYYIMRIAKDTLEAQILCNKADCLHDKEEDFSRAIACNALPGEAPLGMQYYQEKLYAMYIYETGYRLYEIAIDGTGYKPLLDIDSPNPLFCLHRGYLYLATSDATNPNGEDMHYELMRYNLTNMHKPPETLFEQSDKLGQFFSLRAKGTQFFAGRRYVPAGTENALFDTLNIDLNTLEIRYTTTPQEWALLFDDAYVGEYSPQRVAACIEKQERVLQESALARLVDADTPPKGIDAVGNVNYIVLDDYYTAQQTLKNDPGAQVKRTITFCDNKLQPLNAIQAPLDIYLPLGLSDMHYIYLAQPEGSSYYAYMCIPVSDFNNPSAKPQLLYQYQEE